MPCDGADHHARADQDDEEQQHPQQQQQRTGQDANEPSERRATAENCSTSSSSSSSARHERATARMPPGRDEEEPASSTPGGRGLGRRTGGAQQLTARTGSVPGALRVRSDWTTERVEPHPSRRGGSGTGADDSSAPPPPDDPPYLAEAHVVVPPPLVLARRMDDAGSHAEVPVMPERHERHQVSSRTKALVAAVAFLAAAIMGISLGLALKDLSSSPTTTATAGPPPPAPSSTPPAPSGQPSIGRPTEPPVIQGCSKLEESFLQCANPFCTEYMNQVTHYPTVDGTCYGLTNVACSLGMLCPDCDPCPDQAVAWDSCQVEAVCGAFTC
jgi:hypothetical protein